jgi:hypothetical protein
VETLIRSTVRRSVVAAGLALQLLLVLALLMIGEKNSDAFAAFLENWIAEHGASR